MFDMRAPIIFSPAPHETRWYDRLGLPLVLLGNLAMVAFVYPSALTTRARFDPPLARLLAFLRERDRPLIFYSWHAYEQLVVCAVATLPRELIPFGIGHDGILSRMLQRGTTGLGIPVWVYRRRSPVRPSQQLIDFLRNANEPPAVGLFTDAGGPYGEAKRGLLEVARAARAWLVPLTVRARPVVILRKPAPYALPLPFSRIQAFYGKPLDGSVVTLEECSRALADVDRRAHGVWQSHAPPRVTE
jgi:lysophospholipid acyltransferase (LPLAT)-like uncharacterized protein